MVEREKERRKREGMEDGKEFKLGVMGRGEGKGSGWEEKRERKRSWCEKKREKKMCSM